MSEAIESTGQEVVPNGNGEHGPPEPGQQIVPAPAPTLAVTPQVEARELVQRLNVIREAAESAMTENVDYGNVPGTDKPTLFKPGAEKLSVLFQLDVQLANEKQWGPGEHLTVISRATVFHAPTGARLGYGEGVCTTKERKYAYRQAQRKCPSCGVEAVIKGKAEYGGGWICWKKRDGCGAKFADGDQAIESQEAGEIENPDLPDLWNTVVKMAEKRARVDAVLAVTGASAIFTQDVEDSAPPAGVGDPGPAESPPATPQGAGAQAPQATAHERKPSVKPISAAQKGEINRRLAAAELSQAQAFAVRRWWVARKVPDVRHFDRLPSTEASKLIRSLGKDGSGCRVILDDCQVEATKGNELAIQLVSAIDAEELG